MDNREKLKRFLEDMQNRGVPESVVFSKYVHFIIRNNLPWRPPLFVSSGAMFLFFFMATFMIFFVIFSNLTFFVRTPDLNAELYGMSLFISVLFGVVAGILSSSYFYSYRKILKLPEWEDYLESGTKMNPSDCRNNWDKIEYFMWDMKRRGLSGLSAAKKPAGYCLSKNLPVKPAIFRSPFTNFITGFWPFLIPTVFFLLPEVTITDPLFGLIYTWVLMGGVLIGLYLSLHARNMKKILKFPDWKDYPQE